MRVWVCAWVCVSRSFLVVGCDQVSCIDVNPRDSNLLLTCGGDHMMKCWDLRMDGAPLFGIEHSRMVTSAYFSPITGTKIVSTCTDSKCCRDLRTTSGLCTVIRSVVSCCVVVRYRVRSAVDSCVVVSFLLAVQPTLPCRPHTCVGPPAV